jgi:hypothetical protein
MPTKPTLAAPFASSGDKNTIPATSQAGGAASLADGFPAITEQPIAAGGLPPQRKDFNGILHLLSQFAFYQQSGGLFEWANTLDYTAPAMVVGSDGKLYLALLPSGPTTISKGDTVGAKDPTSSPTYWVDYTASILAELALGNIAYLDVVQSWTRQQSPALVERIAVSGSQAVDLDTDALLFINANGDLTIANPTHMAFGRHCTLCLYSSASRTLSWGTAWHGTSLSAALPTALAAGKLLVVSCFCVVTAAGTYMLPAAVIQEA